MMWCYLHLIGGSKALICGGVEKVSPSFSFLWIDGGRALTVWRFSQTFIWEKVFFFHFCMCQKDYVPHVVQLCLSLTVCGAWSGRCHWAFVFKAVCRSLNWWYGTEFMFNCLLSREASALASFVGLVKDEPSTIWWANLSICATGFGALVIFNFWFRESPSFDSPLKTCVWWNRKVSPSASTVILANLL
jgi:hypothetical protein